MAVMATESYVLYSKSGVAMCDSNLLGSDAVQLKYGTKTGEKLRFLTFFMAELQAENFGKPKENQEKIAIFGQFPPVFVHVPVV